MVGERDDLGRRPVVREPQRIGFDAVSRSRIAGVEAAENVSPEEVDDRDEQDDVLVGTHGSR